MTEKSCDTTGIFFSCGYRRTIKNSTVGNSIVVLITTHEISYDTATIGMRFHGSLETAIFYGGRTVGTITSITDNASEMRAIIAGCNAGITYMAVDDRTRKKRSA